MKKIGIIGIGNPLRRDDGLGIFLLEQLQKKKKGFPKNIEFIDGGTGGMNLLHVLVRFDTVIIIDAVDFKGKPGESRVFTLDDIQSQKTSMLPSIHESNFLNVIRLSEELKELPRKVYFFGVQPKDVSFGTRFSEEVAQVIDTLVATLHKKIQILTDEKSQ